MVNNMVFPASPPLPNPPPKLALSVYSMHTHEFLFGKEPLSPKSAQRTPDTKALHILILILEELVQISLWRTFTLLSKKEIADF